MLTRPIIAAALLAALALSAPAMAQDGFTAELGGTVQFDVVGLADSMLPPGTRTSTGGNFRRIRIGVSGQLAKNWLYELTPRFDGSASNRLLIANAFIQYDGFAPFHLKIGSHSPPTSLDDSTSSAEMLFMERAQPSDMLRGLIGGTGRSAATLFAYEENYFAAVSLTGGQLSDSFTRQGALVSRAAWRPWHNEDSSFAIAADTSHLFAPPRTGATHDIRLRSRPEFNGQTVDMRLIDTGDLDANRVSEFGLEMAGQHRNLFAQAGIFHFLVDRAAPALSDPTFRGWYVLGSWILTGETRAWRASRGGYAALRPVQPFGEDGFGAFEIAARYTDMDLDSRAGLAGTPVAADGIRGGHQKIATLGLNWYPNQTVRFMLDYQHVEVARLSGTGGSLDARMNLLSLRSQISF